MSSAPLIQAKNVSRRFDVSRSTLERVLTRAPKRIVHAVEDVSLTIERGETFGLVGESGSGKSTFGRMAVGLLAPNAGAIAIDGLNPSTLGRAGRVQMIFQDPFASLNPRWRVANIIAEPMRVLGSTRDAARQRVGQLLSLVGLAPEDGSRFPHQFSGGQRQRIAIARTLAGKAQFIVCDEPTSALDVSVQAQILNLMSDLQAEFGLTYLLISHNLAVVRHMADHIGVMYLGRLVEVATAHDLFDNPRHPYTRYLLDSIPDTLSPRRDRAPLAGEIPSAIAPPPGCAFHPRCPLAFDRCRVDVPVLIDGVACHVVNPGPTVPR